MSIFTNISTKTVIIAFSRPVPGNIAQGLSDDRAGEVIVILIFDVSSNCCIYCLDVLKTY